eukprot:SAG31_NODE_16055_length_725_cov_0.960064_1_plen_116_part_01
MRQTKSPIPKAKKPTENHQRKSAVYNDLEQQEAKPVSQIAELQRQLADVRAAQGRVRRSAHSLLPNYLIKFLSNGKTAVLSRTTFCFKRPDATFAARILIGCCDVSNTGFQNLILW